MKVIILTNCAHKYIGNNILKYLDIPISINTPIFQQCEVYINSELTRRKSL